jgi:transposase
MAKTFRPYDPDQLLLMPPALADWVPEDHLARFVSDVVDTLDLTAIEGTYAEERGYPPYHPQMMVQVLLYAYCTGIYSSRRIARQLTDSVAFRFLAAGNQPDFRTVSEFRKRHGAALAGLFQQVLRLCRRAGLVKLWVLSALPVRSPDTRTFKGTGSCRRGRLPSGLGRTRS